jgi:hypothetical protein
MTLTVVNAPTSEGGRYKTERNPRTDLKVGHYKTKRERLAGPKRGACTD